MASQADDAVAGAAPPTSETSHIDSTTHLTDSTIDLANHPASPMSTNEEFKDAREHLGDPTPMTEAASPLSTLAPVPPPAEPMQAMPQLTRKETEALGPATEAPITQTTTNTHGTTLSISLMLTTGARHPYKIDERYLKSRKIEATNAQGVFDPREISGYQLKELVWTDWRTEWEPRPATPSSIRLIIMGRMIEDKIALKDFPFKIETVNVVHMTVKPADLIEDEEAAAKGTGKGGVTRFRDGEDRGAGCRCVVQ